MDSPHGPVDTPGVGAAQQGHSKAMGDGRLADAARSDEEVGLRRVDEFGRQQVEHVAVADDVVEVGHEAPPMAR